MSFWSNILGRGEKATSTPIVDVARQVPALPLVWRNDTTMPIVDWKHAWTMAPVSHDAAVLGEYWSHVALSWLEALRGHLGGNYRVARSESFAILSALEDRSLKTTIDFCERSRRRILRDLEGIARTWGHGPHVLLLFEDFDAYDEYIGNYYPGNQEYNVPAGVFLKQGYGHFVMVSKDLMRMECIIAHELTHCLVASLPLPTWLNEGTAVCMEKTIIPRRVDPRRGIYAVREAAERRSAFWNSQTIQEFWSGRAFHRVDDGCGLSYELAEQLTGLIARDFDKYRAYMNEAQRSDAGEAASVSILGYSLGQLAGAVLGEGQWKPRPDAWELPSRDS